MSDIAVTWAIIAALLIFGGLLYVAAWLDMESGMGSNSMDFLIVLLIVCVFLIAGYGLGIAFGLW